jgi:diguanylate cyclase (GGDEF)-like protein
MLNESLKILLVEDTSGDEMLRDLLLAEDIAYELKNAEGVQDSIESVSREDIDIIMFDMNVSTCDGLDSIFHLHRQCPETPIIVITEYDDTDMAESVLQYGAHDYLVKGELDKNLLERSIRYALERHRLVHQLDESKRLERYLAYHDSLTKLPNRHLFLDRLQQSVAQARRAQEQLALLFLDLDGFKRINDTLGHSTGDILLQAVARRLRGGVREVDTIARLGGDEFTIILTGIKNAKDAVTVARKILKLMAKPFPVNEHEFFITASIGISVYPNDGSDIEGLIRKADIAMYRAKGQGKNTYQIYNLSMDEKFFEHLTLESRLRRAVDNDELVVHYQPQIDLESGTICGVEALVRWQSTEFGLVPPDQFIYLAEETGMIVNIDDWVLQAACQQLKAWHREGFADLRVSVNLSARQFRKRGLVEGIERILRNVELPPEYLCLEITESNVMQNVDDTIRILNELKAMGVILSIDDFGTGYSSLNYLKRFPIDILKVDRSFVKGIPNDRDDTAISTAIVVLAQSMELVVVAEGVETLEQIDFLQSLNCNEMQGFYFSKPVTADSLTQLLKSGKSLFRS